MLLIYHELLCYQVCSFNEIDTSEGEQRDYFGSIAKTVTVLTQHELIIKINFLSLSTALSQVSLEVDQGKRGKRTFYFI